MLTTKIDSKMNEMPDENRIKPGDRGIAITRLAPMGTVRVNDLVFEVKSISGYVNPNTEIEIVKVSPSQILVKPIN
jgi:membrane-bound ClpP family serine protease